MKFPVDAKLKDGTPIQLLLAGHKDVEPLRQLYRVIVAEGTSYPHERLPDQDEFMEYWFRGKTTVAAYVQDRAPDKSPMPASPSRPTGGTKGWDGCWGRPCCTTRRSWDIGA